MMEGTSLYVVSVAVCVCLSLHTHIYVIIGTLGHHPTYLNNLDCWALSNKLSIGDRLKGLMEWLCPNMIILNTSDVTLYQDL